MKKIALWAMCIAVMVLSGCRKAPEWKAEHVFVIGLDGWGAYSVAKADMPNVKAFPYPVFGKNSGDIADLFTGPRNGYFGI